MENSKRTSEHQRNSELEAVLNELEYLMQDIGEDKNFTTRHPLIFIMGCARSGSTLLLQYLASLNKFCYPTNLLSRFYYAPYAGALIQKMLYDLDDKQELLKFDNESSEYHSSLGKTKGMLSPHEFWYYWRRFFKFGEIQKLSDTEIESAAWEKFINGLNALQYVNDKPLVLKGMMLNWHIPVLAAKIPQAYFIYVKRNLLYNAQSLLQARKNFFGSYDKWYSFKPPEYSQIKKKHFIEQAADQVYYTNLAIEKGLAEINQSRYLILDYEKFCKMPAKSLAGFLSNANIQLEKIDDETRFEPSQKVTLEENEWVRLTRYTKYYETR